MEIKQIGIIHSPFKKPEGMSIQPVFADGAEGIVEVFDEFTAGLKDLEGFERIWLIYWFHKGKPFKPLVKPYMDTTERGLFATRAPCRPNPIGLSAVRLVRIENSRIYIAEVDILDGSPLLDIKPYVSRFDCYAVKHNGWLDQITDIHWTADSRFYNNGKVKD
jgi:tRNA-Thr(GGU) m(6)t(6)A37 methyltransferase TsaA